MITVAQAVSKIITRKPFLSEALADEIINISSLARSIQREVEELLMKKVQIGAIIMALKRFKPQIDIQIQVKLINSINKLGDIIVRSNLSDYTFKNSETLFKHHINILKHISSKNDAFYTFVQGVFESTFVISDFLETSIDKEFKDEKQISKLANLSAITLKLPDENTSIPGFYYFILRKLAWENINIIEVISTTNEFTIVLQDDDVKRAFPVLKSLKNK